jgi:hypothetical protein
METKRLGWWTRDPYTNGDGEIVVVKRPTKDDFEKFKVLARYRFLSAPYLAALAGCNAKAIHHRFNVLKREPNKWVRIAEEQTEDVRGHFLNTKFYELDSRAVAYLSERGINVPSRKIVRQFEHQVVTDQIMASFEIGVHADPSLRMISWESILNSPKMPAETRDEGEPHVIEVEYTVKAGKQSERVKKRIRKDAKPFIVVRSEGGNEKRHFFSGIETDLGHEPVESYDYERSAINNKFMAELAALDQGLYRAKWGIPNPYTAFYTASRRRLDSFKRCLERLTNGKGSQHILFKLHPTLHSHDKPRPTGHMITEPFERVGYPDLQL